MKDNNCIFCKLANGEIPTATIYEDEDFRVILDANPAAKGHALILPKEHYANLYELDDELAGKSMILAKKMITKLTKALDCDGYNIVQNNGEAAGQTVFHYHVHMIPRHKDDKVGLGWTMHELTEEEKTEIKAGIKAGLEGLAGQIPGLLFIQVHTEGLPSSNADLMLDSCFADAASLKGYSVHPAHVAVADGKVRPNVKCRVCMDYEVTEA